MKTGLISVFIFLTYDFPFSFVCAAWHEGHDCMLHYVEH